jgi:hypothetical protein
MSIAEYDTVPSVDADAIARFDLVARIDQKVELSRVANVRSKGTEYHGACPQCGGVNRLYVQDKAGQDGRALFRCRQCKIAGDALTWLRDIEGLSFGDACKELGMPQGSYSSHGRNRYRPQAIPAEPEVVHAPSEKWQARANTHLVQCQAELWFPPNGSRALAYLRSRGFTDESIHDAGLGYCAADRFVPRAEFGLADLEDPKTGRTITQLRLHRGIVIPWWIGGELWRVETRRPVTSEDWECVPGAQLLTSGQDAVGAVWRALKQSGFSSPLRLARTLGLKLDDVFAAVEWLAEQKLIDHASKYLPIPGGQNCVFGVDCVTKDRPAVLVEGRLNALAIAQEAGDLVTACAIGATTHGRKAKWIAKLGRAPYTLIALDNDPDPAKGEAHAGYWLDALQPKALRWRPILKDANAMLAEGQSVRAWVQAGMAWAVSLGPETPARKPTADDWRAAGYTVEQHPGSDVFWPSHPRSAATYEPPPDLVRSWDDDDIQGAMVAALHYVVEPSLLGSTGLRVEALELFGVPLWRVIDTADDRVVGVYLDEQEAHGAARG